MNKNILFISAVSFVFIVVPAISSAFTLEDLAGFFIVEIVNNAVILIIAVLESWKVYVRHRNYNLVLASPAYKIVFCNKVFQIFPYIAFDYPVKAIRVLWYI